ncbi:MAG TPA: hypothetical protein PL167_04390, partial [Cyclobacteriaceae bacterium]|nr:hypothetical protein [Cyclobacteriaceae bacterium]
MKSAYHQPGVYNLSVIKDAKRWLKHDFITQEQFDRISEEYKTPFYHPNLIIRVLLFIATLFAISGVTGLLGLIFADAGQTAISVLCILYGI